MMEAERKRQSRRRLPRQKSFTDALKEKYCTPEIDSCNSGGFMVDIVYHGKPKTNGSDAELAYLRNVVLCDRYVSMAGIPSTGLRSLCPNVNELDLSGNLLDDWSEVLNIMSHLPFLKFVNLSRNQLVNKKNCLQTWETPFTMVESLVLNETNVSWDEVMTMANYLPSLKELHICKNGYTKLSSSNLKVLEKVKYLKMNYNEIQSWEEVWKLRYLPELDTLILSGNPLEDVVYKLLDDQDHVSMETNNQDAVNKDTLPEKDVEKDENGNKSPDQQVKDIVDLIITGALSEIGQAEVVKSEIAQQNNNMDIHSDEGRNVENVSENDKGTEDVPENDKGTDVPENDKGTEDVLENDKGTEDVPENDKGTEDVPENDKGTEDVPENDKGTENDTDNDKTTENGSENGTENDRGIENGTDNNINIDERKDNHCGLCINENKAASMFYLEPKEDLSDGSSTLRNDKDRQAFRKLKSLCVSDTCIASWEHLQALSMFPALESLRIQDIQLLAEVGEDDRRKLKIASLPNIKILNGSEVSPTEREKAERYYIRYFMDQEKQPERYYELEAKHGKLKPIVDIDISRGFKEEATLTFIFNGVSLGEKTFKVKALVKELQRFLLKTLGTRCFKMFHYGCGPNHPHGEEVLFQELQSELLQISRYDILDGDEIHVSVDVDDDCKRWTPRKF
ncbi:tubulin-specific chaperone cofactor E-like protein [Ylistrum balloti]|uniref:tubulin-specific chaperone cofactor E-like protein n=1 Tax=Ylistrum balloti TaxID=509963 RepID=UPI0029059FFF|nr:tubulin-specific chaperone cofactor E-like protein [Ylistrum balloti]